MDQRMPLEPDHRLPFSLPGKCNGGNPAGDNRMNADTVIRSFLQTAVFHVEGAA